MNTNGFVLDSTKYGNISFTVIFDDIKKAIIQCGKDCIIAPIDLPCKALCDSACNIDAGFAKMIEDGNLLCAAALVRMQIDNALRAWAGIICTNKDYYLNLFLDDDAKLNKLDINWEQLDAYGITEEQVEARIEKYDKKHISNNFLYETLDIVRSGAKDIYKKGCGYVHPSTSLLKAAWFENEADKLKYKSWDEVKPFGYNEAEIVKDYLDACSILYWVLKQWLALKQQNIELINSAQIVETQAEIDDNTKHQIELLQHKNNNE